MPERPLGTPCKKCGRTGHCRDLGPNGNQPCCCTHASHARSQRCDLCGHGGNSTPQSRDSTLEDPWVVVIDSEEALEEYLRALNDGGVDPTAAGMDGAQMPFLAMLRGCYADEHVVLFNTPWDSEVGFPETRCEECNGGEPSTFKDLTFPITVLVNADV